MSTRFRASRRAFTLIELLVVVAIIAMLIAIMLPSLGRAKALASRTACAANLKGICTAYAVYINGNDNYVPTGNFANAVNVTWRLYNNTSSTVRWAALGYPYREGDIGGPKVMFCPTQKNPFYTMVGQNPPGDPASPPLGTNFRAGYSIYYAPDWNNGIPSGGCAVAPGVPYQKIGKLYKATDLMPAVTATGPEVPIAAFITDVATDYTFIDNTHGDGINAAYVDWSVSWIPRKAVAPLGKSLHDFTDPAVFPNGNTLTNAQAQQTIYDILGQLK